MSEPIHLTFVSDTTDEFPDNTNANFKVRLPERMTLKGGWYVSLWKMTVPDHSQSSSVISSDMDLKVVKSTLKILQFTNKNSKGKFQFVNLKTMTKSSTLKYIMSDDKPVSSGVQFWQNVMTDLHNTFIKQLQFEKNVKNDDLLLIPQEWFPSVKFDANGFTLEKVPFKTTKDYSTFLIIFLSSSNNPQRHSQVIWFCGLRPYQTSLHRWSQYIVCDRRRCLSSFKSSLGFLPRLGTVLMQA